MKLLEKDRKISRILTGQDIRRSREELHTPYLSIPITFNGYPSSPVLTTGHSKRVTKEYREVKTESMNHVHNTKNIISYSMKPCLVSKHH